MGLAVCLRLDLEIDLHWSRHHLPSTEDQGRATACLLSRRVRRGPCSFCIVIIEGAHSNLQQFSVVNYMLTCSMATRRRRRQLVRVMSRNIATSLVLDKQCYSDTDS